MCKQTKTIEEINAKLEAGTAVVMTAMEFKAQVRAGKLFTPADVDVVTTATRAVMSGTSALLSIPAGSLPGNGKVLSVRLNGVPALAEFNESLADGHIQVLINGTEESLDHHGHYGGGHLLRALVEGKSVEVEFQTGSGGRHFTVTLADLPFARMYTSRNAYQNYMGFTNVKNAPAYVKNPLSIFSCRPIPPLSGLTACGTGELNPAENDPERAVIKAGIRILLNGAEGIVAGYGTRASAEQICLSTIADLKSMDPQYMGGFRTSHGVEVLSSLAVPFPVTDQAILNNLAACLDENLPHKIGDLSDRLKLTEVRYADIWKNAPLEVQFDPERCIGCSFQCEAEYYCPMNAISWKDKAIDQDLCVACGACTGNCPGGAFMGKGWEPRRGLGDVRIFGQSVPIIFRMSNRLRAERLAGVLKERMLNRMFYLLDTDSPCVLWHP